MRFNKNTLVKSISSVPFYLPMWLLEKLHLHRGLLCIFTGRRCLGKDVFSCLTFSSLRLWESVFVYGVRRGPTLSPDIRGAFMHVPAGHSPMSSGHPGSQVASARGPEGHTHMGGRHCPQREGASQARRRTWGCPAACCCEPTPLEALPLPGEPRCISESPRVVMPPPLEDKGAATYLTQGGWGNTQAGTEAHLQLMG